MDVAGAKAVDRQVIRALSAATFVLVNDLYERHRRGNPVLASIVAIGNTNETAAIRELMPFGMDDVAVRAILHRLGRQLRAEEWTAFDDHLRHFQWKEGLDWHALSPKSVRQLRIADDADRFFVGLLTSHANGFVRAEAVRLIACDLSPMLLPFLLVRLTDWVDEVRVAAEQALLFRIREAETGAVFVDCLGLLDRLALSTRLRPECLVWVDELLLTRRCAQDLRRGMALPSHGIRRKCFRLAARHAEFDAHEVLGQAIRDSDVLIRKWAYAEADADFVRKHAAKDRFGPFRRLAFDAIAADQSSHLEHFLPFLLDRAKSLRQDCQRIVKDRFAMSAAEFYRERLSMGIAIVGLAESGANQHDQAAITAILATGSAPMRRAAIRALRLLGDVPPDVLLPLLASDCSAVAIEAAATLLAERTLPADAVWAEASRNPDRMVRARILRFLKHCSKWMQLRLLLAAAADSHPAVSSRGVALLDRWINRFNQSFTQPTDEDRRAILALLPVAKKHLSDATTRQLTFLIP